MASNVQVQYRRAKMPNTLSFTESTYSLSGMIYTDDEYSGIEEKYISHPQREGAQVLPTSNNNIQALVYKIAFKSDFIGYYISDVSVNPAAGASFIQAITSEPFVHYIVDSIVAEKSIPDTVFIPAPIQSLYECNAQTVSLGEQYMTSSVPPTCVHLREVEIEVNDGYLSDMYEEDVLYRNMDFYEVEGNYFNGDIAYLLFGDTIEQVYTKLLSSTTNGSDYSMYDNTRISLASKACYNGETFDQPVQAALVFGKVLGYQDYIEAVAGRHPFGGCSREHQEIYCRCSTSHITAAYSNYLKELSKNRAYVVDTTVNFNTYAKPLNFTSDHQNEVKNGSLFINWLWSKYLYNPLRDFVTKDVLPIRFNTIRERVTLLREAIALSLPTETILNYGFSLDDCHEVVDFTKPLVAIVTRNRSITYDLCLPHSRLSDLEDMNEDTLYHWAVKARTSLKDSNTFSYGNIKTAPDFLKIQSLLKSTKGFTGQFYLYELSPVILGEDKVVVVRYTIPINSTELYLNPFILKTLLLHETESYKIVGRDLTPLTKILYNQVVDFHEFLGDYTTSHFKPENWSNLQNYNSHVDEVLEFPTGSLLHESFFDYRLYGSETNYIPVFDFIEEHRNFGVESCIHPKCHNSLDPIRGIRGAIMNSKQEETMNRLSQDINAFSQDSSKLYEQAKKDVNTQSVEHATTIFKDSLPINVYMLACERGTKDIVYPILGTYCKLGVLESYTSYTDINSGQSAIEGNPLVRYRTIKRKVMPL